MGQFSALPERLLQQNTMMEAENELLAAGPLALPLLASILDGTARNRFGVAYRSLGLPLRCAVEVAARLGPVAKPLESLLTRELAAGYMPAAMALGCLGTLDEATILALADCLDSSDGDLAVESAVALVRCGQAEHAEVARATKHSPQAARNFARLRGRVQ